MRIALFSDNFYPELGGIQDAILTIGRALVARGHEVCFCAPSFSRKDAEISQVPFAEVPLVSGMHVRRFASFHVPSSSQQSRLVIPTFRRWRSLREFRPDVIHTHTFAGVGLEALRAAKKLGIPLVGTNHWAVSGFQEYPFLKHRAIFRATQNYLTWYYGHCDRVTAPSKLALREIGNVGVPTEVLSNPIDTALFSPVSADMVAQKRRDFGFTGPTVAFAGRLAGEKKIDVVIRAVARLRSSIPGITLALAGHGSERSALEALARELGCSDAVRFLGTLSPTELADLLRSADVFAIASTSETQSMVLLQAMACGIPAVGVDSLALPEYIRSGVTGSVVAPGDSDAMAEAIRVLLSDPAKRQAWGRAAHDIVRSTFSVKAVIERLEAIYSEVLFSKKSQ